MCDTHNPKLLLLPDWSCGPAARQPSLPDDHSESVPPLPIPNRTVKRLYADDSADSRVKVGNRQAPHLKTPAQSGGGFCFAAPQPTPPPTRPLNKNAGRGMCCPHPASAPYDRVSHAAWSGALSRHRSSLTSSWRRRASAQQCRSSGVPMMS